MRRGRKFYLTIIVFLLHGFTYSSELSDKISKCRWKSFDDVGLIFERVNINVVNLTFSQLQEDLACLSFLYRNVYAGTEVFGDEIYNLNIRNSLSSKDLYKQLIDHHKQFVDYHFIIDSYDLMWGPALVSNGETNQPSANISKLSSIDDNVYYFRPGSLEELESYNKVQNEFLDLISDKDLDVIIDLRDNNGGSNDLANSLAQKIYTNGERFPTSKNKIKVSLLTVIGLINQRRLDEGKDTNIDDLLKLYREIESDDTSFLDYEIIEIENEIPNYGIRSDKYNGRIILYTNGNCSSACETFVEKLSPLEQVIHIGHNTKGALKFGNPVTFELPNSKLQVTLSYRVEEYENGAVEGEGYKPDVVIDPSTSILEVYNRFFN